MRLAGSALAAAVRERAAPLEIDDPADLQGATVLLQALYDAGRSDLPLGRLLEGHVDAVQIVRRYGSERQRAEVAAITRGGGLVGVWNADLAGEPLRLAQGRLAGAKSFASGAGLLSHALVTVDALEGRQLLLLDLSIQPPDIDASWWRTIGMQRSETHIVRWRDAAVGSDALIGGPGDYSREPWFSGGALRFAAVQAGGVAALFDHARDDLVARGRSDHPIQAARLADLFFCAQAAADAVRRALQASFEAPGADVPLVHVAAARVRVADAAEQALALSQQAVGLQGLFETHPLAAAVADLTVYLRQPAPDAQRQRVGKAAGEGKLSPCL